jgi:hypothetical protein
MNNPTYNAILDADFDRIFGHAKVAPEPAAKEFAPTATDLIGLVSAEYGVSPDTAGRWLRDAFAPVPA